MSLTCWSADRLVVSTDWPHFYDSKFLSFLELKKDAKKMQMSVLKTSSSWILWLDFSWMRILSTTKRYTSLLACASCYSVRLVLGTEKWLLWLRLGTYNFHPDFFVCNLENCMCLDYLEMENGVKKAASTRLPLGEPSEYLEEPYWIYIKQNEAPKHFLYCEEHKLWLHPVI